MADTIKSTSTPTVHAQPVINPDGSNVGSSLSAAQTDGSQKTQIVDAGGEQATITGGKLDVNASIDTAGLATSAKQDTLLTELQLKADLTETQPVSLASVPSHAVTNATASSFNAQVVGSVASGSADSGNPVRISGTYNATPPTFSDGVRAGLQADSKGSLRIVNMDAAGNARGANVDANSNLGVVLAAETTKVIGTINIAAAQTLATVTAVTAITNALPAGTNAIGKLAANSGVDIGDVDVTSAVITSGTITTVSTLTGGGIAHDSADSGNPHKMGAKAYSPDGTAPGTAVAEADRTDLKADLDGRLFTNSTHPRSLSFHSDGSSALTDTSVAADPGDGFQIVVTSIIFSTGAATACNIFFEEGATKVLGPWYLEATAGRGVVWTGNKPITASTALTVTTSAAIAQSLDVCYFIQAV